MPVVPPHLKNAIESHLRVIGTRPAWTQDGQILALDTGYIRRNFPESERLTPDNIATVRAHIQQAITAAVHTVQNESHQQNSAESNVVTDLIQIDRDLSRRYPVQFHPTRELTPSRRMLRSARRRDLSPRRGTFEAVMPNVLDAASAISLAPVSVTKPDLFQHAIAWKFGLFPPNPVQLRVGERERTQISTALGNIDEAISFCSYVKVDSSQNDIINKIEQLEERLLAKANGVRDVIGESHEELRDVGFAQGRPDSEFLVNQYLLKIRELTTKSIIDLLKVNTSALNEIHAQKILVAMDEFNNCLKAVNETLEETNGARLGGFEPILESAPESHDTNWIDGAELPAGHRSHLPFPNIKRLLHTQDLDADFPLAEIWQNPHEAYEFGHSKIQVLKHTENQDARQQAAIQILKAAEFLKHEYSYEQADLIGFLLQYLNSTAPTLHSREYETYLAAQAVTLANENALPNYARAMLAFHLSTPRVLNLLTPTGISKFTEALRKLPDPLYKIDPQLSRTIALRSLRLLLDHPMQAHENSSKYEARVLGTAIKLFFENGSNTQNIVRADDPREFFETISGLLDWARREGTDLYSQRLVAMDMLLEIAKKPHISPNNRSKTMNVLTSMTQDRSLNVQQRAQWAKNLINSHTQGQFIDISREEYYFGLRAVVDRLLVESANELDGADIRFFETFMNRTPHQPTSPGASASSPMQSPTQRTAVPITATLTSSSNSEATELTEPDRNIHRPQQADAREITRRLPSSPQPSVSSSTQLPPQSTAVSVAATRASSSNAEATELTESNRNINIVTRPQQTTADQSRSVAGRQTLLRVLNSQIQTLLDKTVAQEMRLNIFRNLIQDHTVLSIKHKDDILTIAEQWQDQATLPIVVKLLMGNTMHYSEEQQDRIAGLMVDLHGNEDAQQLLYS